MFFFSSNFDHSHFWFVHSNKKKQPHYVSCVVVVLFSFTCSLVPFRLCDIEKNRFRCVCEKRRTKNKINKKKKMFSCTNWFLEWFPIIRCECFYLCSFQFVCIEKTVCAAHAKIKTHTNETFSNWKMRQTSNWAVTKLYCYTIVISSEGTERIYIWIGDDYDNHTLTNNKSTTRETTTFFLLQAKQNFGW